jgi:hypothetical protein
VVIANAHRNVRRANAIACLATKELFDDAVLEGVIGNDRKPCARAVEQTVGFF